MTADSVERRLHGVAIYNPDLLSKHELVAQFVARQELLDQIVADLHRPGFNQHQIIVGTRGMGKTTLLRRIRYAIEDDAALAAVWFPLTFPEEQYNVGRLSDLYLNFIDALGDALEQSGRREEAAALDEAVEALPRGDEDRRASAALDLLLGMARQMDRRLVLLVDNLDLVLERLEEQDGAQWAFRELLSQEPRLLLVGAMPVVIGATYDYGAPFYDFFRIHELRGLTRAETRDVLARLAQELNAPEVERLLEHDPARVDTLHTLTGGNPRTIALLFSVLARGTDGDVRSDLEKLLDQCTPLYKARFESLSPQAQQVVDAVAIHWDPISAGELTEKLPMEVNAISAQLNRLVQQGVIEKVEYHPATKTGFQVAERFFNIWYLMRASRRVRRRLIWLVQFLRLFYGADQVKTKARDLLERALRGSSDEKLRHAEFCLAIAQLIDDDLQMRFALESRAIRTMLADQSLNQQIASLLDLDGEDMALRGVIDRERWLEEFNGAIDKLELDADENERARHAIGSVPISREARLAAARSLGEHAKQDRERLYADLEESGRRSIGGFYGPRFAAKVMRALAEGFLEDLNDQAGALLAASVLDPELEILGSPTDDRLAELIRHSDSSISKALLAASFLERDDIEAAVPLITSIPTDEESAFTQFVSGTVAMRAGRLNEAAVFFERSARTAPAPALAWHSVGQIQLILGHADQAVMAFENAVAEERETQFLVDYGHALTQVERYVEAESVLREVLRQDPDHLAAATKLGVVLLQQQRAAEALDLANRFIHSADTTMQFVHAGALAAVGQRDEALAILRKLLEIEAVPSRVLALVMLLYVVEAPQDAVVGLRRVLSTGAESVIAMTTSLVDALGAAAKKGYGNDVLQLVEEFDLQDAIRPGYEALRIFVSGKREALKRLAPEVQQATAELLDRWQPPRAVAEKKPRRKAASRRRRRRLT